MNVVDYICRNMAPFKVDRATKKKKSASKTDSKNKKTRPKNKKRKKTAHIHNHRHFLILICSEKQTRKRNKILDLADEGDIDALCDCVHNLLNGNIEAKQSQLNKLHKHRYTLRKLVKPKVTLKERKKVLKQKGGFLQFLLPILAPILGALAKNIL